MTDKDKHEELIGHLNSPGWRLLPHQEGPAVEGTLEQMVRAAHLRKQNGKEPGVISRIEKTLELDVFELEQLWWHLGLPT